MINNLKQLAQLCCFKESLPLVSLITVNGSSAAQIKKKLREKLFYIFLHLIHQKFSGFCIKIISILWPFSQQLHCYHLSISHYHLNQDCCKFSCFHSINSPTIDLSKHKSYDTLFKILLWLPISFKVKAQVLVIT